MEELVTEARINQNAADTMDAAVADLLGVNRTDVICLDILARLGTVPAGRLAEESRLTTGAITAVLDRLEKAGYVRRAADPTDRRRVLVETTDRFRELAELAWGPVAEELIASGTRFTREQLDGIGEFLRLGSELSYRRAEELSEGNRPEEAPKARRQGAAPTGEHP
jgi:DNA-binding MarR family transcriptional regulator